MTTVARIALFGFKSALVFSEISPFSVDCKDGP